MVAGSKRRPDWKLDDGRMGTCDLLVEALYQVFTTTLLFPPADQERYYQSLCSIGYAETADQGHAHGYRITPAGHAVASARWGHEQSG